MPMKLFEVRETHYCCFCREAILFGEEGVFIRGREHHAHRACQRRARG
jgi:hypothetical protein